MNQITKQQKAQVATLFAQALDKRAAQLTSLGISKEHFQQMLLNALVRNPQLATCTQASLYDAVFRCVEWGMAPDGKHGAIVPLKNKAEFWPMIDGILLKVRQAIPNISIHSDAVFEGDDWEDIRGTKASLYHVPNPQVERDERNLLAVYAVAHLPGNDMPEYEVMYASEAATFRKQNRGPWTTHPIQMYRGRVLKRLINRLPIGLSLMAQIHQDEDAMVIDESEIIEAEVVEPEPEPEPPKKKAPPKRKAAPKPAPAPEPEPEPEPEAEEEPEEEDDEEDIF